MARSTTMHPPPRRPVPPTRSLGRGPTLEPADRSWPAATALLVCAAVISVPLGSITDHMPLGVLAVAVLAIIASMVIAVGLRNDARRALHSNIVLALHPLLGGAAPTRTSVRLARWTRGRHGHPRRIKVHCAPSVNVKDNDWASSVAVAITRLIEIDVAVTDLNPRRCRATFRPAAAADTEVVDDTQQRAARITSELLGSSSKTSGFVFDDESELTGFRVAHAAGIKVAQAMVRHRVERTISTMLPGRWRARWDLESDEVNFARRPAMPSYVSHPIEPVTDENRKVLPYGMDEDGRRVTWSLKASDSQPHFLVVGATGTGKTVCINGLAMEACRRDWRVRICDPKRIEFVGLRTWPNVEIVATAVEEIVAVIEATHAEMEHRYELIENGEVFDGDFEPLLLVLDEYRYFYGVVNAWYTSVKPKGGGTKCPILERVFAIASLGRSAGVHLIMGTQRPDADWLGGDLRDQFAARSSLGRLSPQGAQMMWGAPHVGVAVPRGVPGRATGVDVDGMPAEVQTFWTPDPRRLGSSNDVDREILAALRPAEARHPRAVVIPPTAGLDGSEIDDDPLYMDYALAPLEPAADHPDLDRVAAAPDISNAPAESPSDIEPVMDSSAGDTGFDEDLGDGYQDPAQKRVSSIVAGDLISLDDADGEWVVVEDTEPDVDDDDTICISWRNDLDESGMQIIPADERITVRKPHVLEEE